MLGRSVLLLAGSFALLSAVAPAGRDTPVSKVRGSSAAVPDRDLPAFRLPVRSPTLPRPTPWHFRGSREFSILAHTASAIFSGTVTRLESRPAVNGSQTVGTVNITFHVETALRGAARGREFTISEWIGLWHSGQRYRIGERVLVFLYPRSKVGLTSCVSGPIGRFELDSQNRVLFSPQQLSIFRKDPVVGGKSRVPFSDFASAVRQASEEE